MIRGDNNKVKGRLLQGFQVCIRSFLANRSNIASCVNVINSE